MLIHFEKKSVLSSDSAWSGGIISKNTDHRLHGMLNQVFIKADTSTRLFKFKLTNPDGLVTFDSLDFAEGTLNNTNVFIPLKGTYTMTIYDTTADGFEILLGLKEDN